uniref:Secreted protein n=2 Tax=Haematobia irritans TaxID=7368 RepID=A0A1L8E5Y4_HAEIR
MFVATSTTMLNWALTTFLLVLWLLWATLTTTVSFPWDTATSVGGKLTSTYWFTRWTSNIGCLVAFFAYYNVEFHNFAIANRPNSFFGVISDDSTLMDKHIFFSVVTVDKPITALNIKPFNGTSYLGSNNFLDNRRLFLLSSITLWGVLRLLLLLLLLELRVFHIYSICWSYSSFYQES